MTDKASAGAVRENTRTIGRYGEDAACAYLEENGYRIVGRNVYADTVKQIFWRRTKPTSSLRKSRPAKSIRMPPTGSEGLPMR